MRKCYIEENGVKYEETDGTDICGPYVEPRLFRQYKEKYPRVLVSNEKEPSEQIRIVEGKLWYLRSPRKKTYFPGGEPFYQEIAPVYNNREKKIGFARISTPMKEVVYCYWVPVTKDMLHDLPQESEGGDEQGDS